MVKIIDALAGWEDSVELDDSFSEIAVEKNLLPVFNLFPWLAKATEGLPSLLSLHRKYICATKPLVVVSFSS